MEHQVRTTHIQSLIEGSLALAQAVDGRQAGSVIATLSPDVYDGDEPPRVEHALCKAVSDLRHAADELDAERLSCYGWRQR